MSPAASRRFRTATQRRAITQTRLGVHTLRTVSHTAHPSVDRREPLSRIILLWANGRMLRRLRRHLGDVGNSKLPDGVPIAIPRDARSARLPTRSRGPQAPPERRRLVARRDLLDSAPLLPQHPSLFLGHHNGRDSECPSPRSLHATPSQPPCAHPPCGRSSPIPSVAMARVAHPAARPVIHGESIQERRHGAPR